MKDMFAVAAALHTSDEKTKYLFGLRNASCREYRHVWSMPSCQILASEYETATQTQILSNSIIDKLKASCFENLDANIVDARLIKYGSRYRRDYRLKILIIEGIVDDSIKLSKRKYDNYQFSSINSILKISRYQVGSCVSLLSQHLVDEDLIDSAIQILELSPELMDRHQDLSSYTAEELWKHSAANYGLLREGESGGDGEFIRHISLDRHIEYHLDCDLSKEAHVVDLGCGSGDLVVSLLERGCKATGLDYLPDPLGKHTKYQANLVQGRIEDAVLNFGEHRFSLAIMNLVCQWIDKIDKVAFAVSKILKPNGKLLVTLVPPEFAKNGHWIKEDNDYNWLVTEPLRRDKLLVMINRHIGPFWFYPRNTPEYIQSFGRYNLLCRSAEYIFIDSKLNPMEWVKLKNDKPSLKRHEKIPVFLFMQFEYKPH